MKYRLWKGMGLTPRIGILIVVTLIATQILDRLMVALVPAPHILFYTREWIADRTVEAARLAESTPLAQRRGALAHMDSKWLAFTVKTGEAAAAAEKSPALDGLQRAIASRLDAQFSPVIVRAQSVGEPERETSAIAVILLSLPAMLLNRLDDSFEEEVIAASQFEVSVGLPDGTRLTVAPPTGNLTGIRRLRNVAVLLGGLALIAVVSLVAARSITRPLRQFATAADRLGRERKPTPIPVFGVSELDVIGRTFNETQRRLKRFVEQRTQLLATISHDLRTPLTRLRLFAEFVPDKHQQQQVLSDIAEMDGLIKASLALASEEINSEAHSRFDIAALLISLCDMMNDSGGDALYDGPDHAELPCQATAIRRAFSNLIDNACQYGDHARVTLHDGPDAIEVVIADSGPGISAEDTERAFEPFQRLGDSHLRVVSGFGLGLTIARDAIHGHGGDITLEPNVPTGLLVRVVLPKPDSTREVTKEAPRATRQLKTAAL